MGLSDQQIAPAGAHGAILGTYERQIARDRIVARDAAGGRRRSAVLPAMTGLASMRMLRARLHLERCHQLRPRSHLATIASEARAPETLAHGIVGGPGPPGLTPSALGLPLGPGALASARAVPPTLAPAAPVLPAAAPTPTGPAAPPPAAPGPDAPPTPAPAEPAAAGPLPAPAPEAPLTPAPPAPPPAEAPAPFPPPFRLPPPLAAPRPPGPLARAIPISETSCTATTSGAASKSSARPTTYGREAQVRRAIATSPSSSGRPSLRPGFI